MENIQFENLAATAFLCNANDLDESPFPLLERERASSSSYAFLHRSPAKQKPEMSPTFMHPVLQAKVRVIHKNPFLFHMLHERLRTIRFHLNQQVIYNEIQAFLAVLKIVEVREEIKHHTLVLPDCMSSFRYFLDKTKSMWSPEMYGDDSTVGTNDTSDTKSWSPSWSTGGWGTGWGSRVSGAWAERKGLRLFSRLGAAKAIDSPTSNVDGNTEPTFLFLPPADEKTTKIRPVKDLVLINSSEDTKSTTSNTHDDDSTSFRSISLVSAGGQSWLSNRAENHWHSIMF